MKKAVIDIGTNSCRLFIGEVENNKIKKKMLKFMEITQLGKDVDKTGILSSESIERTVKVLKKYRAKIDELGVEVIDVIATSATRDSSNKMKFIDEVRRETNLDIRCISGEEEGNYSFLGAMSEFDKKIMVMDIGGGSTEFILGFKNNIDYIKSFNVGAVRLNEKFFIENPKINEAKKWVKNLLKPLEKYRSEEFILVGVAGTVTTHVSVLLEMEEYDTKRVHMYRLTKSEIEKNLTLFLKSTLEERKNIVGLHPKRANVIISGTYLLLWVMEILGRSEIIVSEADILEGLIVEDRRKARL